MKCPHCSRNQRRGREGMTCKSCSYSFLFDPKKDRLSSTVKLHDQLFQKIIRHAGAGGTYCFTPNQFFSSARHFGRSRTVGCLVIGIILTTVFAVGLFLDFLPLLVFSCFFLFILVLGGSISLITGQKPKRKNWDRLVTRWRKSGRPVPGLINSPALTNPPPDWEEKDIHDYGVSSLLLCERPELVDLLVLNHFHSQTNTLILSAAGYPSYLLDKTDALLQESPDLPVYLLHEPATSGKSMKARCPLLFEGDIDLSPRPDTLSRLTLLRKRFSRNELKSLPLDVVPYRTLSAALSYGLTHGVTLDAVLEPETPHDSDTDISFG